MSGSQYLTTAGPPFWVLLIAFLPEEGQPGATFDIEDAAIGMAEAVIAAGGQLIVVGDPTVVALTAVEAGPTIALFNGDSQSPLRQRVSAIIHIKENEMAALEDDLAALEDMERAGQLELHVIPTIEGLTQMVQSVLGDAEPSALVQVGQEAQTLRSGQALQNVWLGAQLIRLVAEQLAQGDVWTEQTVLGKMEEDLARLIQNDEYTSTAAFQGSETYSVNPAFRQTGLSRVLWSPKYIPYSLISQVLVAQLRDSAKNE